MSALAAMLGALHQRIAHGGLRCEDQGCQCTARSPRENSERPANHALHRLAIVQRVTPSSGTPALPFAACCKSIRSGGQQTFNQNHSLGSGLSLAAPHARPGTRSPPAFSRPAPPPLRRALFCFHYPRAYLTTTAQPPTGPDSILLSHIIKLPNTRNRCLDPTLRLSLYWPA